MFTSSKQKLFDKRLRLPKGDFEMINLGGDLTALAAHAIFWVIVDIIIESGMFSCLCKSFCGCLLRPIQNL